MLNTELRLGSSHENTDSYSICLTGSELSHSAYFFSSCIYLAEIFILENFCCFENIIHENIVFA